MRIPTGTTRLLFLFGANLTYSRSPHLQNGWLTEAKLDVCYLPLAASSPNDFISVVESLCSSPSFLGGNITNPYKSVLVGHGGFVLDERVKAIGAANTLFQKDGLWSLTNTDVDGILVTLSEFPGLVDSFVKEPDRSAVLILGAGGAAAAAAFALQSRFPGLNLAIGCREQSRAHSYLIKNSFPLFRIDDEGFSGREWVQGARHRLLINTLPLGQKGEHNPASRFFIESYLKKIPEQSFYFDMTYGNPPAIAAAKSAGVASSDGRLMLESQARRSFEIWVRSLG